ncbi:MAG: radical SAM protein [Candidatus Aegiribacteria sp.]|nr:radical SAM protein [Candidatus Aegiribacteria sp.]
MPDLSNNLIVQLPLNPSAPLETTGNIPLAGASLAAAASLPPEIVIDQNTVDTAGDRKLVDIIVDRSPALVAFTLYMWNAERSAWLAKILKKKLPGIVTVAGGPEVSLDNEWLTSSDAFDLMISGEGEEHADKFLDPVSARRIIHDNGNFLDVGRMNFTPGMYPNPWLTGYLDPSGGASVYVETIRGCAGGCTYCSYRRTHPSARVLDAKSAERLLRKLIDEGAGEIVFLDPTFNSRGDLVQLLEGMRTLEADFFGEMRGDLISPDIAALIADAGFRNVEIGLQSLNRNTLKKAGRPADPYMVLDGALNLKKAGVSPIIDLILDLPGDKPRDAVRTAHMIRDRELHHNVQVFYLSILPGTVIRQECVGRHMPYPPYYGLYDSGMGGFAEAREEIADIVGYDLDLAGRPLLFDGWSGTELIDLSANPLLQRQMPSCRHGAIRITSEDLWADKRLLLEFVRIRLKADPYCVLDVILCPKREFPLDLVDMVRGLDNPVDYSGRTAIALGRQGNLRVCVLIEDSDHFRRDWISSASTACTVVIDADSPAELSREFWDAGISVRLPGSDWNLTELSSEVPALHQVLFRDKCMEESWSRTLDI